MLNLFNVWFLCIPFQHIYSHDDRQDTLEEQQLGTLGPAMIKANQSVEDSIRAVKLSPQKEGSDADTVSSVPGMSQTEVSSEVVDKKIEFLSRQLPEESGIEGDDDTVVVTHPIILNAIPAEEPQPTQRQETTYESASSQFQLVMKKLEKFSHKLLVTQLLKLATTRCTHQELGQEMGVASPNQRLSELKHPKTETYRKIPENGRNVQKVWNWFATTPLEEITRITGVTKEQYIQEIRAFERHVTGSISRHLHPQASVSSTKATALEEKVAVTPPPHAKPEEKELSHSLAGLRLDMREPDY